MTRGEPWTDEENEAIVDAYFSMLELELSGRPFVKAEVRRELQTGALRKRSHASIDFKFRNISGVLEDYEQLWIEGYKPAFNYQAELERAVVAKREARGVQLPPKHVRERG